ncbi:unnamed protein product [Mycena citricolor]|uniref:Opine dehydrogenase domain-containing protein n=1 Tax=Mycena citricolor TaxID=2018698 RepID=A0AAD2K6E5_9AGAR|nr:unnamed protein product [Mycena citricolor]
MSTVVRTDDAAKLRVAYLGCGPGTSSCVTYSMAYAPIKPQIKIWAAPDHRKDYNTFKAAGRIKSVGIYNSEVSPIFCDDLTDAVTDAKYIIVTIPAEGVFSLIDTFSRLDWGDKIVILIDCFYLYPILRDLFAGARVLMANSLPFGTRMEGSAVNIFFEKAVLQIGGSPIPARTQEEVASLFLPRLEWCMDALHCALSAKNDVVHAGPSLLISGSIGRLGPDFRFYKDAIGSAAGVKLVLKLDEEKRRVVEALGYPAEDFIPWFNRIYATEHPDFETFARESRTHNMHPFAPTSLRHRFIASDIQHGIVPLIKLAKIAGVEVPAFTLVAVLAGYITGVDFFACETTVAALGLTPGASTVNDILCAFDATHRV